MAKKGLGKGLDSLFETDSIPALSEDTKNQETTEIKLSMIEPNPNQPRNYFDPDALETLAESIAEHGLIQPITITPRNNGRYMIVAGERRWRAAKKAGLTSIPALIKELSDEEIAKLALIENLQREDLNPIEEALGYKSLIDDYSLTQEAVSKIIGKSRSAVANSLRLLVLDDDIQKLLIDGSLTGGHARALLAVENRKDREILAKRIIEEELNVRQAEALAKQLNKPKKQQSKPVADAYSIELDRLQERLASGLGTKVKISHTKKRGKIEIEYYGNEDLERILNLINMGE